MARSRQADSRRDRWGCRRGEKNGAKNPEEHDRDNQIPEPIPQPSLNRQEKAPPRLGVVFIKQLRCNWNLTVHDGAYLFILLFSFQFSFLLWSKLGLFLLFPFAFVFTSLITHICFSVIENEGSSQLRQTSLTFSALGPFGPCPSVYDTRCPSWSSS
jgi:hypothetical protein